MKHRIRWENKNFGDIGTLSFLLRSRTTFVAFFKKVDILIKRLHSKTRAFYRETLIKVERKMFTLSLAISRGKVDNVCC